MSYMKDYAICVENNEKAQHEMDSNTMKYLTAESHYFGHHRDTVRFVLIEASRTIEQCIKQRGVMNV